MQTHVTEMKSNRPGLQVAVEEQRNDPGVWTVEAIDMEGDGSIYQTFFAGPEARKRAYEYARFKYGLAD